MHLKPIHKKLLKVFSVCVILLVITFFSFRNSILHWITDEVITRIKDRTGASLTINESGFSGLSTVTMHGISLVPSYGDTLFTADTIEARVSIWMLLSATIRMKELTASGVNLNISCRGDSCNYESLLHQKQPDSTRKKKQPGEKNYASLFRSMLDKVFDLTPQKASIHTVTLDYSNDTLKRSVSLTEFTSDENSLRGRVEDLHSGSSWNIVGVFSQTKRSVSVSIYPDSSYAFVPLLKELTGTSLSVDTLTMSLSGYHSSGQEQIARGRFAINGFGFHHQRISDDTIRVPSAAFAFSFHAGKSYFEIDSTSRISLSGIQVTPHIRYELGTEKIYSLKLRTDNTPANDFFESLPEGIFDEVRDIKADGKLQFSLDFRLNSKYPDSVIFESSMKKEKFRLRKFGSSNLMRMNDEFIHNVYERGRLVRSFPVGPSNPAYTTLDRISPNFVNAVLTSEDGNFFHHNGFNESAFRKSIAVNYKEGKFKRGGSTISMQLVKNVFLTRKKTIARKAEEALLVWLIESNRLYTKERMLEVYMNIIELGPGIYGIGEATPFYFNKRPDELNLPESIFLASLLPHPKWFKYSFDTLGNLKPYLGDYYRIVSAFMLKKELITQQQHDELIPNVTLLGPARELVVPSDTLLREEDLELEELE